VSELERQLTQLGRELDWPPAPDLASSVRARLDAAPGPARDGSREGYAGEPSARPGRRGLLPRGVLVPAGLRRSLAIAVVALLVLAGGVFAAVPGVRDAVLEFFGLQGATVERREQLPPPPPPSPLRLGERTTLADAPDSLGFAPLVPEAAGRPEGVFVDESVPGGELSLAYRPQPGLPEARATGLGLLVSEFRGDLLPEYTGKIAGQATRVERIRVDGDRAIWLEGAPHYFFYRAPGEPFREEGLRIAQNVLLLERGRVLVRLEGAFSKERALDLARSLR
jgi:hypothetical protein